MRIDLRDGDRKPLGRVEVDPAARPTRVTLAAAGRSGSRGESADGGDGGSDGLPRADARDGSREVFLTWEGALDDAGHLRRCVACGSQGLFRTKSFPQITLFVVVLAFAGAVVAALGYATDPKVLAALVVVLVVDVAILLFSRALLVCYRCRSTYALLPIAADTTDVGTGAQAERHATAAKAEGLTPPTPRSTTAR